MAEDTTNASADAGSAGSEGSGSGDAGQTAQEETVPKSQYDELFSKMGKMGEEKGIYKKFYEDVEPLMDLLEKNPEIEEALTSGKFDAEMAKAILDGRVTREEATTVADAHQQVKKDMGKEEYDKATPEEISTKVEKLVEEKLNAVLKPVIEKNAKELEDMSSKMEASKELADNEQKIRDFVNSTPDFGEFSSEIMEKMEEIPGLSVVEAYERVKAHHIVSEAGKNQNAQNAQSMKDIAANSRGGQGTRSGEVVTGDKRNDFIRMDGGSGFGLGQ